MPIASRRTPVIWTMVATRNCQSSVSNADENHEKFVQAQQLARPEMANPISPGPMWPAA
jgi:hypothetical protein